MNGKGESVVRKGASAKVSYGTEIKGKFKEEISVKERGKGTA